MAHGSSPLPIRHANSLPQAPSLNRRPITIDDEDELGADTIPCSPGAVLRHDDTTQPTQVLGRPTNLESSSPPSSVIEVPASSPFQAPKRQALGSRLAPQGTLFRPPQRPAASTKRPAAESIDLISDDEDDLTPPRGDIKPTTFKAHVSSFSYNAESDKKEKEKKEKDFKVKMRQVYDALGPRFTADNVRKALKDTDNDVEDAIELLERQSGRQGSSSSANVGAQKPAGRRLMTKAALQARNSHRSSPVSVSSRSASPASQPQKVQKAPKRRLMQGLKRPSTPSPQKPAASSQSSVSAVETPPVIDLVSNDNDEAYEAERSPTPDEEGFSKVLESINSSTVQELAAMTGMTEANLQPIMDQRPFSTLSQARDVRMPKKPGSRKVARTSVGEGVVDAVETFLEAVDAIDYIVAECEKKAKTVKKVMDSWDMDSFGHDRRSGASSPEYPPTPTSLNGTKLSRPPIPKQPLFMDGHCQMKPFQLFGLNWMSLLHTYDIGCILADEMGLGKTCQVISLMSHIVESFDIETKSEEERPWPNLIVVPPSTYNNWLAEFEKFAPELSVIGYRGSANERMEIAYEVEQAPEDYHVVLATYSQINSPQDIQGVNSMSLHAAVFDEGHKMKNPETKLYKDLQRVQTDWKMLLTGTPVQNNLLEMTALLNFINPKMFDGYMEQIKYIFNPKVSIRDVSNGAFLYSERVKRARTILEPFILQRRKDQVVADLPQKIQNVVLCEMTDKQKSVYDEYENRFKQGPQPVLPTKGRGNDQNNIWMQLRKSAVHPLLFRRHFTDEKVTKMASILMDRLSQDELRQPNIEHLIQELKNSSDFELHLWCRDYPRLLRQFDYSPEAEADSGKVKKLIELLEEYQKNGDRVLVFSKFSRVIELLCEVLALRNIQHKVLMGSTNVAERQEMIDEFNADESIPAFLLTTGAGGTGINLTSANKVVIFDQSDNPQDDIQAENRAHRLGQRRDVEIIRLISKGTIEELVHKACAKKIELANKVTGAVPDENMQDAERNVEAEVRKMLGSQLTPP